MSIQISSNKIKARKDHVCDWCNLKIDKGKIYRKSFNVMDGDPFTWKNHIHCEKIAEHLKMFDDLDYGLTEDLFQENINKQRHLAHNIQAHNLKVVGSNPTPATTFRV